MPLLLDSIMLNSGTRLDKKKTGEMSSSLGPDLKLSSPGINLRLCNNVERPAVDKASVHITELE